MDLTTNVAAADELVDRSAVQPSGIFTAAGSTRTTTRTQYNYAAKHNPMVFFTDTNGGCNTTTSNPLRAQLRPAAAAGARSAERRRGRLQLDYAEPVQRHAHRAHQRVRWSSGTPATRATAPTSRRATTSWPGSCRLIMASDAYKDHGVIVLWWDESEGGDTPAVHAAVHHHLQGCARERGRAAVREHDPSTPTRRSCARCRKSSTSIRHGYPWLGDAAIATDLSALFKPARSSSVRPAANTAISERACTCVCMPFLVVCGRLEVTLWPRGMQGALKLTRGALLTLICKTPAPVPVFDPLLPHSMCHRLARTSRELTLHFRSIH